MKLRKNCTSYFRVFKTHFSVTHTESIYSLSTGKQLLPHYRGMFVANTVLAVRKEKNEDFKHPVNDLTHERRL